MINGLDGMDQWTAQRSIVLIMVFVIGQGEICMEVSVPNLYSPCDSKLSHSLTDPHEKSDDGQSKWQRKHAQVDESSSLPQRKRHWRKLNDEIVIKTAVSFDHELGSAAIR